MDQNNPSPSTYFINDYQKNHNGIKFEHFLDR